MLDLYLLDWYIHQEDKGNYKLLVIDKGADELLYVAHVKGNLSKAVHLAREAHKQIWYNCYSINEILQ